MAEEVKDRRAYNQGRPKISELEKLRRRVRRQSERCRELRKQLDIVGWEERQLHTGPGRPKKLRQDKVRDELLRLRRMAQELRRYEREQGEPHVPLDQIRDPLVDNQTMHAVGRKPADELTHIDYEIKRTLDRIFELVREVYHYDSIFPDKPDRGRIPLNRLEKLQFQQDKLREHVARMLEIEKGLNNIQRISRQIKLLYDAAREARKAAKKTSKDTERRYYESREAAIYEEINNLKAHVREVQEQKDQLGLNIDARPIYIERHFDYKIEQAHKEIAKIEEHYLNIQSC
ncbi:hypothetical protein HNO53_12960 [Billgrantia antri]|uniref:Uncharacterized protein n=1 Tax=Halomonas sulfidivorans TaxID=2733488 RepID=A0ABX7WHM8_9GAMM|nr:hypothetical protein [Halomonas sulfidivorans]QTP59546.1 hypothetical protein HNO53_12960 [Halomonas sulfidivorans]